MRRLAGRAGQVILLSHSKPFLCRIWEWASPTARVALEVARDGTGSTLRAWDVNRDCVTENDRQHAMLRDYLRTNAPNIREVARAIRPVLEAFMRVAYPEHFPPGTLLGPFRYLCEQRVGTRQQILNASDTEELRNLVEYANGFHHDTNPHAIGSSTTRNSGVMLSVRWPLLAGEGGRIGACGRSFRILKMVTSRNC